MYCTKQQTVIMIYARLLHAGAPQLFQPPSRSQRCRSWCDSYTLRLLAGPFSPSKNCFLH